MHIKTCLQGVPAIISASRCLYPFVKAIVDVETVGAPFCSNWRDLFLCSLVKHELNMHLNAFSFAHTLN